MPGGLGTLDELTEILTLMQTHKTKAFPVILFDTGYWKGFLEWLRDNSLSRELIERGDKGMLAHERFSMHLQLGYQRYSKTYDELSKVRADVT